jgi:hypothetical protein
LNSSFPVSFPVVPATGIGGERNENITTVDYGSHWRALGCNLTAKILHPSPLGSLAPIQREATQALVADLSAQVRGSDGRVVGVRDPINTTVFGLVARLCFGDGELVLKRDTSICSYMFTKMKTIQHESCAE